MSLKKILLVVTTSLVVFGGLSLPCQAQSLGQLSQLNRRRPLRWLGQGYSDGYHRCNPGHDTSYYNPYTAHNSNLVSQSPEYQALLAQQASQQPTQRFFAGVPFSVYAAPNQLTPGLHNLPGQQVQGSFSPSVGSGVDENSFEDDNDFEDDSDFEDDNDFREDDEFRDDDNDFREDDNDFREDDEFRDDDNDFRDDDSDFREDDEFREELMEEKELDKEIEFDHDAEDVDIETSENLGGISGLSLSGLE